MDSSHRVTAKTGLVTTFFQDFRASVVVFLVALPLCVAIGLASIPNNEANQTFYQNAAAIGIITGIIGGLVVGWFSGSPLQVSGPAAGLIVVVYGFILEYSFFHLTLALILAGAIQVVAGLLRWGQIFRAVAPAVIQGMLAGIGVLIFADQFHVMLDHASPGKGLKALLTIPDAILEVFSLANPTHRWSAIIGITTITLMLIWQYFGPKKLKFVPPPLVGVIVATALSALIMYDFEAIRFRPVAMPDNLLQAITLPRWTLLTQWEDIVVILQVAVTIAVIASAETLLCAGAVDRMQTAVRTRYDQELAAQGVGNMLCGLVGGLPMTGVIVRSAANVDAGGKSRSSTIMHGAWLLIFVAFIPFVVSIVPISSLAAILVLTGFKLVNPKVVKSLWKVGKGELFIYIATLVMIVVTDLLTGVLVGIGLSAAKLLYQFARLSIRLEDDPDRKRTVMHLNGTATFIKLPKLAAALEEVKSGTELHVNMERLSYIDHACLDLLMNWEKQHRATGGSLVIDWDSLTAKFRSSEQPSSSEKSDRISPSNRTEPDQPKRSAEYFVEIGASNGDH